MALPKLAVPHFDLKLPSTGETIEYRPFLVKEEKVLLMAIEGDDEKEMGRALKSIIDDCTFGKHDVNSFAPFDIEYLFLNLRAKSVGETVDAFWPCKGKKCEENMEIGIDLEKVEVIKNDKHVKQVKLTEHVGMQMKYPTLEELAGNTLDENNVEDVLTVIASCVESIWNGDEISKAKDLEPGELIEWLGSLTQTQFASIQAFFTTMPKVQYKDTVVCKKCKHKNEIVIEGMKNFFG